MYCELAKFNQVLILLNVILLCVQFTSSVHALGSIKNVERFQIQNMTRTYINNNFVPKTKQPDRGNTGKIWQVGRVSRQQYEIINMLMKKPYQSLSATVKNTKQYNPINYGNRMLTYSPIRSRSLTPSFIELYYLDYNDDQLKLRKNYMTNSTINYHFDKKSKIITALKNPFLSFHIEEHNLSDKINNIHSIRMPTLISEKVKEKLKTRVESDQDKSIFFSLLPIKRNNLAPKPKLKSEYTAKKKLLVNPDKNFIYETCPVTTTEQIGKNISINTDNVPQFTAEANITNSGEINVSLFTEKLLGNDKIRFFEIYDHYTKKPAMKYRDNVIKSVVANHENYVDRNRQIILEDVFQNIGHHNSSKIKTFKKHITESLASSLNNTVLNVEPQKKFKSVTFHTNKTLIKQRNGNLKGIFSNASPEWSERTSNLVPWSNYPFTAVYIYEPLQIQCDAAALSPHWLVAAGACLSRFHNKDLMSEGPSAFVAYCGEKWWEPERVSYVKYSLVHPGFHPTDKIRRILYNIGLVRVAESMSSSCFGWAPITLISHNFAPEPDGTFASTIGWGLDRYTTSELPKNPLSLYEHLVHSSTCPGNNEYSNLGLLKDNEVVKNLYCMRLPPYFGEEKDPVHGSMLLVGGKLIALYLQEVRRPWGDQSAQYTGVWGLVPWVHDVAREPEGFDTLSLEI